LIEESVNRMYRLLLMGLLACMTLSSGNLGAQVSQAFDPSRPEMTRADLEELLVRYDEVLASTAYSRELKASAALEAARVRQRLREGDFQTGDRVVLTIQGEAGYPDTIPVGPGPAIRLPLLGSIDLDGVLRSELEDHLRTELGRVINEPVVEAQALMRITVQGAVGNQGFFFVPGEALVDEVLMLTGGPARDADLEEMRIVRGGNVILEGAALQEAVREGRTLDQLNLRAGEQLVLPEESGGGVSFGLITSLLGVVTSIILIAR